MKSGNLNFLEPSGPLQACNGTVLPLLYLGYLEPGSYKLCDAKNVQFNKPDLCNRGLLKFSVKVIVRGLSGRTDL